MLLYPDLVYTNLNLAESYETAKRISITDERGSTRSRRSAFCCTSPPRAGLAKLRGDLGEARGTRIEARDEYGRIMDASWTHHGRIMMASVCGML
jgi:hypothetical protein